MRKSTHKLFLLFCFFGIVLNSKAEESLVEKVIYDFSQSWLKYDKYYEAYLPVKTRQLRNSKSVHQSISIEKYRNYNLSFKATKGLALFVNNKLIYKKISGEQEDVRLPLNTIDPGLTGDVIFTFYHPDGVLPLYSATITNKVLVRSQTIEERKNLTYTRDMSKKIQDYFILFLIIVSLFILFKQLYPKEFLRYYAIRVQENSDHLLPGIFSIPSLWMALMNGLSLSLLLHLLKMNELLFNSSFSLLYGTFFIVLFYMAFFIGKYFYIFTMAWLFNYSKVVTSQFSEFVRLLEIVCLLATVMIFGIEASGFFKINIKPVILYYSLIIVLIFCVVKVIFLFFRLITRRNLYLFSYICAAEILPLIITVKILLF
jgi:hypothetical protein